MSVSIGEKKRKKKKKKDPNFLEDRKLNVFVLSESKRSKQCDQSAAGIKCFLQVSLYPWEQMMAMAALFTFLKVTV